MRFGVLMPTRSATCFHTLPMPAKTARNRANQSPRRFSRTCLPFRECEDYSHLTCMRTRYRDSFRDRLTTSSAKRYFSRISSQSTRKQKTSLRSPLMSEEVSASVPLRGTLRRRSDFLNRYRSASSTKITSQPTKIRERHMEQDRVSKENMFG